MYEIDLPSLRRKYGPVFVTSLENGSTIPWKQLTLGEYIEYSALLEGELYARATIEDEIFEKCVLDEYIVDDLPALKAGTVTTVVQDIVQNSGPTTISNLNATLNVFRGIALQAIHQTVTLVCQAFPAYKPEDVYGMNYADFMLRLAQAEFKLLQMGILETPINFEDPAAAPEAPQEDKKGAMDMYLDYLEQQNKAKASTIVPPTKPPTKPVAKPVVQPPPSKPLSTSNQTIITAQDSQSQAGELAGHEQADMGMSAEQMMTDAAHIYKDYMNQLRHNKDLQIKTPEERLVEAEKRAAENKIKLEEKLKKQQLQQQVADKKYDHLFKKKRRPAKKPK